MEMTDKNCPTCGETLIDIDVFDTEYDCGTYYDYCTGECPKCKRAYRWTDVYTFARVEDFAPMTTEREKLTFTLPII